MSRAALLSGAGVALAATALAIAGAGMAAHMAAHMAAVAVAAPLLALGLPRGGGSPLAASLAELAVVWGWHLPAARAITDGSMVLTLVEQLAFLAAGTWLWRAALAHRAAGIGALLLTSMHMTLLGALIALATRPLYPAMTSHAAMAGIDPLTDQQLGGVVMLLVGAASYLLGGLALLAGVLQQREAAT